MPRGSGRRPGKPDTRQAILTAAREVFAERGYDNATIRQVAAGAGVDPALIHHYFGTKEQLFLATVAAPVQPDELLANLFRQQPVGGLGERVVTTFLGVWEDPVSGPSARALVRSAVTSSLSARLLREFFNVQIVRRVVRELGTEITPAEIPFRASLVSSQLFGLALIRYVLAFEPLASAPQKQVVAAVAPNIQRYLTGELYPGPADGPTRRS